MVLAGVGVLVGVAYTWRAMQKAFFDDAGEATAPSRPQRFEPISAPERIGAAILIGASLLIGLYPHLLLRVIVPSFESPLFQWLRSGGAQ